MTGPPLRLAALPLPAKIILTAFLAIIGFGYLAALGNLYHQHRMADGRPELSIDDIRVVFQGMTVAARGSATPSASSGKKSRMLQMVEPGGDMRKHLQKGGEDSVRALIAWLTAGAPEAQFDKTGLVQAGDPSARAVIERQCLKCHNAEDGERKQDPYGRDSFDADFAMVWKYAAPGTAEESAASSQVARAGTGDYIPPHAISHLFLISHIHMLSIPIFTVIVAALFLCTGLRPRLRGFLAPIPMLALVFDFASWWLARWIGPALYVIPAAGAIYGLTFGVQLLVVAGATWGRRQLNGGRVAGG